MYKPIFKSLLFQYECWLWFVGCSESDRGSWIPSDGGFTIPDAIPDGMVYDGTLVISLEMGGKWKLSGQISKGTKWPFPIFMDITEVTNNEFEKLSK